MDVLSNAGSIEDGSGSVEVASSLTSALRGDECDKVKGLSDDGHSYAGTVVRGVREAIASESGFFFEILVTSSLFPCSL